MRRAPVIHRKLWRDEFGVDGAEAVFKESTVSSFFQDIYHVDMTTDETPINPGRLKDVQFEGSIEGKRTVCSRQRFLIVVFA